jgi:glycerol-3-phosphate dehydrogenase (NAD(P)+)
MEKSNKIAVIGGGSWATALVKILCNNVPVVNWWMRNDDAVEHIHTFKHNPNYLQSVEFDFPLQIGFEINPCVSDLPIREQLLL